MQTKRALIPEDIFSPVQKHLTKDFVRMLAFTTTIANGRTWPGTAFKISKDFAEETSRREFQSPQNTKRLGSSMYRPNFATPTPVSLSTTALGTASSQWDVKAKKATQTSSPDGTSISNTISLITDSGTSVPSDATYSPLFAPTATYSAVTSREPVAPDSTSSDSSTNSASSSSDKGGIIAGAVLGAVFGLSLLSFIIICIVCYKKRQLDQQNMRYDSSGNPQYYPNVSSYANFDHEQLKWNNIYDEHSTIERLEPPGAYAASPFDSEDLLRIDRIVMPHDQSEDKNERLFQYYPRPEIMHPRAAPPPPRRIDNSPEQRDDTNIEQNGFLSPHQLQSMGSSSITPPLQSRAKFKDSMSQQHCSQESQPFNGAIYSMPGKARTSLTSSTYRNLHRTKAKSLPQLPDLVFPPMELVPHELLTSQDSAEHSNDEISTTKTPSVIGTTARHESPGNISMNHTARPDSKRTSQSSSIYSCTSEPRKSISVPVSTPSLQKMDSKSSRNSTNQDEEVVSQSDYCFANTPTIEEINAPNEETFFDRISRIPGVILPPPKRNDSDNLQ